MTRKKIKSSEAIPGISERMRVEQKLRQSEALYRSIGESIDYGVWICAPDGRNTYASESFLKMAGITQEQCSNFGWGNLLHPNDAERTIAAWKECVRTGGKWDIEHRFRGVDDQWHHVLARGLPVRNERGEIICWAGINLDINRFKQTEEALRASEERLSFALEASRIGAWDLDLKDHTAFRSIEHDRIFGYAELLPSWSYEKFMEHVLPEDRRKVSDLFRNATENKTDWNFKCRIRRADGVIRWIWATGRLQFDVSGKASRIAGIVQDITYRKEMEQGTMRLASFPQNNPMPVLEIDANRRVIYANPAATELLEKQGVPNETNLFFPEDIDRILEILCSGKREAYSREIKIKDIFFLETVSVLPELRVVRIYACDITRRKQTEEMLQRSEERLRLAQEKASVGVWDWNVETGALDFTPELNKLYGLAPGTIKTYQDWRDRVHPDDIGEIEAGRDEAISRRHPFDLEFRGRHSSGEYRWISTKGGAIYNEAGKAIRVFGVNVDITERRQTQEELQKSEERFRTMADSISQLAWIGRADGYLYWYNRRWYEYTGMTPEQMEGWGWQKVHDPDVLPKVLEQWTASIATGQTFEMEFPLRGADGKFRMFLTRGIPFKDSQGHVVQWFGTNTDVSESRRAEEMLRKNKQQLERMVRRKTSELEVKHRQLKGLADELFGAVDKERKRLAAVLHDDLQQILVGCKMHLNRANYSGKTRDKINELLVRAIETLRSLSSELRPPVLIKEGLVAGMRWFASQVFNKHRLKINIKSDDYEEIENANINSMLYQCLHELIFNIVKHADVSVATLSFANVRGCSQIILEDRGIGFNVSENLKGKKAGIGGIGLFSLGELLDAIGGKYHIESSPKRGTRVIITIPRQETKSLLPSEGGAAEGSLHKKSKIYVLVADDHHMVREGIVNALEEDQNISVIGQAADGLEAVSKADMLKPDVVLLDLNMPALNGIEVTRRLRKKKIKAKIIIMSIDIDKVTKKNTLEAGADAFVPKSANIDSLKQIIRSFGT